MKKYLSALLLSFLLAAPLTLQAQKVKKVKTDYVFVDSIAPSKAVPSWVEANPSALEAEALTPGYYPIIVRQSGESLDYVKLIVNRMDIPIQAASEISSSVRGVAAEMSTVGNDEVSRALSLVSENLVKAKVSGLRKNQEWWVLKKYTKNGTAGNKTYKKGESVYDYAVMYIVDKKIMQRLLQDAMRDAVGKDPSLALEVKDTLDQLFGTSL